MSSVDRRQIIDKTDHSYQEAIAKRSLAARLTAWYFVTSFLLVLLSSAILYWAATSALQWADDQVVTKRMGAMKDLLQAETPSEPLITHEVGDDNQGPRQIFIRIIIDSKTYAVETAHMAEKLPASTFPDVSELPFGVIQLSTIARPDGLVYRALSVRTRVGANAGASEATIQVATDTSLDAAVLERFRAILAIVVVLALFLCSLIGWQIVRQELEPLRRISAATSKISMSTLSYRVPAAGLPTELRELANKINEMLTRLESASAGLKQYADNVAHELRTPLHQMLVGTEVVLSKDRTLDDYREALETNVEECNRLSRIVKGLLFLARADNRQATLDRQDLDIGNELSLIQDFFNSIAADAGVSLTNECAGTIKARIDRVLFQRAVGNLVANAIAHTPRGGEVSIQALARENGVAVEVADTGEGIASEHQSRIFDRFYRVNIPRTGDDNRLGLGLSITRSIVELHGGTISLLSEIARGTKITLVFPR